MAEEALKFKSSLDDSDFQSGLKRMEKGAYQVSSKIEARQAASSRKSAEAISNFVESSKDSFKALGEIAIGAGIGLQLDNALVRVAELVGKIREANKEAGRAGAVAGGERGAGAGVGFESRIKAIQDFNSELSKSKSLQDSIGSSLASSSQEYFKQKDALIKAQEATGQITADESKRAQIENDRGAALAEVASKQEALNRDAIETADRIANLQQELIAAKNAQYSADVSIRDAGAKQAEILSRMIADEQTRKALYDAQANTLEEQRKTVEAIAQARAATQVKDEAKNMAKGIEEAQKEAKKAFDENQKSAEAIGEALKKAAQDGAKKVADEMEKAKEAMEATKRAAKEAFEDRVENILKSPDERRQDRRDRNKRERAESRANRDIAREQRDAERLRRDGGTTTRKLEGKNPIDLANPTIMAMGKIFTQAVTQLLTK